MISRKHKHFGDWRVAKDTAVVGGALRHPKGIEMKFWANESISHGKGKTTADPSTPLRYGRDDSVMSKRSREEIPLESDRGGRRPLLRGTVVNRSRAQWTVSLLQEPHVA